MVPTSADVLGIDIPKGLLSYLETVMSSMVTTSWGTVDWVWVRTGGGGGCELIEITCPNGLRGGMRPSPCDDAIMFGPKAQKEGRGIFGRTNVKENVLETTEKIDSY